MLNGRISILFEDTWGLRGSKTRGSYQNKPCENSNYLSLVSPLRCSLKFPAGWEGNDPRNCSHRFLLSDKNIILDTEIITGGRIMSQDHNTGSYHRKIVSYKNWCWNGNFYWSHDEDILSDCLILWVDGIQPREPINTDPTLRDWVFSKESYRLHSVYTPFHSKYPKPFSGSTQSISCFLLPHFFGRKLIKS